MLALAGAVVLAAPGAATATEVRTFKSVREHDGVAVFHVKGVRPSAVRVAYAEVGRARRGLRERAVRRSLEDGRIEARIGRRLTRRPGRSKLVLRTRDVPGVDFIDTSDGYVASSTTYTRGGHPSAYAEYEGGGDNGYARGVIEVDWKEGDTVRFGAAFFLPEGFHGSVQGQVDLLRWDNWPSSGGSSDWGGVGIWGSDRLARLLRFGSGRGDSDTLGGPLRLPEGRWFTLEVRQLLSSAAVPSEWLIDGRVVARSLQPTTYGNSVDRVRIGIVAIDSGDQTNRLGLYFSDPFAERISGL